MYAHIPQDFNIDIEVNGEITGLNLGDTKFLGSKARIVTSGVDSSIKARRLRTDDCQIQTIHGDILVGSYVESSNLLISTAKGNVSIQKKLGVSGKG